MKLIMLSTDENIFKEGSEVRSRMFEYGKLVEELHIIVLTARNYQFSNLPPSQRLRRAGKSQSFGNVFVYPAAGYVGIFKVGKNIISKLLNSLTVQLLITTQDPFELGLIGYLLKRKFRLPLQIQIHTDFLSPCFWRESLRNKIRVILGKRLVKKADCIRVVGERIKKSLVISHELLVDKITVLPIFVDVEKIRNAQVKTDLHKKYPGRFIILMASRLTREKNIGLAIEVIKKLEDADLRIKCKSADCGYKENQQSASSAYHSRNQHHKALLLIVGSGPKLNNLKLQVSSCKLQDFVRFEPWTNDLASYYKTADLFLLASNYEGYGRTVIEAAAAGLPVVMTDVGIAFGKVVPVGDRKKLISAIESLIGNKDLRAKIIDEQNLVLKNLTSKDEFLNNIKSSWSRCFDIEDPRFR